MGNCCACNSEEHQIMLGTSWMREREMEKNLSATKVMQVDRTDLSPDGKDYDNLDSRKEKSKEVRMNIYQGY